VSRKEIIGEVTLQIDKMDIKNGFKEDIMALGLNVKK
jgi:hypothetical protein